MRPLATSERRLVGAVVAAACVCALALSWRSRAAAAREAGAASAEHATVLMQARRLTALRNERALVADRLRAEPDLVARLQSCLHASGVEPAALTQVSASEPQGVAPPRNPGGASGGGGMSGGGPGGHALKRQQVAVTLDPLRPADLARFLVAWRESEPLWTVRAVRLQRSGSAKGGGQAGANAADDRASAVLVLDNVFLAQPRTQERSQ